MKGIHCTKWCRHKCSAALMMSNIAHNFVALVVSVITVLTDIEITLYNWYVIWKNTSIVGYEQGSIHILCG